MSDFHLFQIDCYPQENFLHLTVLAPADVKMSPCNEDLKLEGHLLWVARTLDVEVCFHLDTAIPPLRHSSPLISCAQF